MVNLQIGSRVIDPLSFMSKWQSHDLQQKHSMNHTWHWLIFYIILYDELQRTNTFKLLQFFQLWLEIHKTYFWSSSYLRLEGNFIVRISISIISCNLVSTFRHSVSVFRKQLPMPIKLYLLQFFHSHRKSPYHFHTEFTCLMIQPFK